MKFDNLKIVDTPDFKTVTSSDYNFTFDKKNGIFKRWGITQDDDPKYAPSLEILDCEVSTICNGLSKPCPWCYKSNTSVGENMSFETFKIILDKMPRTLTQVAFGIGNIDANVDLFKMFDYCRESGIIPNVTINGARMTGELYDRLAKVCGAVAVSSYHDDDICFNAVKELTNRRMSQVNLHKMLCRESYRECFDLLLKTKEDPRLAKLNAVVFLFMKPKGDRNKFHMLDDYNNYKRLIDFALVIGARIGFDSCSAPYFMKYVRDYMDKSSPGPDADKWSQLLQLVEPCESFGMFSSYINVKGEYFPCSFCENHGDFKNGIDILKVKDFKEEVWHSKIINKYRDIMINKYDNKDYSCPLFDMRLK